MSGPHDRVPAPEATGTAGTSFDVRAGAIARLLRGDRAPALARPLTRVRPQERVPSAVLDDIDEVRWKSL
jgi:hypothetical protein